MFSRPHANGGVQPNVPGIGYGSIPILSGWVATYRLLKRPVQLFNEGVEQYKRRPFRISTLQGEYTVVLEPKQVSEYIRAPDDVLGMQEAANEVGIRSLTWSMSGQSFADIAEGATDSLDYGLWSSMAHISYACDQASAHEQYQAVLRYHAR
jgi:hypothetical protein